MFKEFKAFVLRGNVMDLAVAVIIGAAFNAIVQSLVNDILMPPIGLLVGRVDFSNLFVVLRAGETPGPYATLAAAQDAGAVAISYGVFVNTVIWFVITAFAVFLLIRGVNQLRRKEAAPAAAPTTKECPHCLSTVPLGATRCPYCTSELEAV
jgi:large conductance mechanosensitive channel